MPRRRLKPAKPRRIAGARRPGSLALAARCELAVLDALKASLQKAVERPATVTIDASAVTCIDAAALQLLAAFARERHGAGRKLAWHGVPKCLHEAARRLGLAQALMVPAT